VKEEQRQAELEREVEDTIGKAIQKRRWEIRGRET